MSINYTLWPNTDGQLGKIKTIIPDGVNKFWPDGDILVDNYVYKDGNLVGFVDTKALINNRSKSTIINYDYFDIELPFTEGEIAITRGPRSKYFNVRYSVSNDENVVITLKYKACTTVDEVKAVDPDYLTNDIVDGVWNEGLGDLENSVDMFRDCSSLTSFTSDLSSLTGGEYMFAYSENVSEFNAELPNLTNGSHMFTGCEHLTSFSSDLSSLTHGEWMFGGCSNLTAFSSDLSSLTDGRYMFHYCSNLAEFDSDLSSLTNGEFMFIGCERLTSFSSDLSSLTKGTGMFAYCSSLESFSSDLSSLMYGQYMFQGCKLDTASVQHIADTINTYNGLIHIGIGNSTPNDQEETAFNEMVTRGWTVYVGVNGGSLSQWNPTSLTPIDGEEPTNPISFWAKSVQSDEEHACYVDENGNFYNILGGNYIYGDDLSTYGMFMSEEDAAVNMRLTKYVKPVEKA